MSHYFEIHTNRKIENKLRKVRKDRHQILLPLAQKITDGHYDVIDLNFFIDGYQVDANAFAGEVFRMEDARIAKEQKNSTFIWVPKGESIFSIYARPIRIRTA